MNEKEEENKKYRNPLTKKQLDFLDKMMIDVWYKKFGVDENNNGEIE